MSEHDISVQSAQRRAKLAQLRAEGDPYPSSLNASDVIERKCLPSSTMTT